MVRTSQTSKNRNHSQHSKIQILDTLLSDQESCKYTPLSEFFLMAQKNDKLVIKKEKVS